MKTKLQYWEQNSELDLFVKMAALPLAFLGLLLVISLTLSDYSEATQQAELPTIAYQNP